MLAVKHGTGKLDHGYMKQYERHFAPIRYKKQNILEIGVAKGCSVRMWQEYFPNSMIYAIDIANKKEYESNKIKIFQGSQNDPVFLNQVAKKIGKIDILIDDGSHINEHVITSFNILFPYLADNGLYVIEDLHTSYLPKMGGNYKDLNQSTSSMSMLKSLVDGLNYEYIPKRMIQKFDSDIVSVHFYSKIVFIYKGNNKHFLQTGDRINIELAEIN